MDNVQNNERYTPFSPMTSFLQVIGIFGCFPLTPVSENDERLEHRSRHRSFGSAARRKFEHENSWDDFFAFEVKNLKLVWCYVANTLVWILTLALFFSISYGYDYSGLDYLFPLNVTTRYYRLFVFNHINEL